MKRDPLSEARMYDRYVTIFRALDGCTTSEALSVLMCAFVAIAKACGVNLLACVKACVDIWEDDDVGMPPPDGDDGPPTERERHLN